MSEKKNKKPINEHKWYLLIIIVALGLFYIYPLYTLLGIGFFSLIIHLRYDLDDIGKIGRKHPVWTTIILFTFGIELYLWIYKYGLLWKEQYAQQPWIELLANIKNGKVVVGNSTLDFTELLKKGVVMMISTPASIIPIILAPYFWVLWIWRHNDKEYDKKRNEELDEQGRFNRIIDMVGSTEVNLRSGGMMLLDGFLTRYEDNDLEYKYYCGAAISVLANNYFPVNDGMFNSRVMCHKSFAVCLILQNKHYKICGKLAGTPLCFDFNVNDYIVRYYELCIDNSQEFVFVRCVVRLDILLCLLRNSEYAKIFSKMKFKKSIFEMTDYYLKHRIPDDLIVFFSDKNKVYECLLMCPEDNFANKEAFKIINNSNDNFYIGFKYDKEGN